MADKKRKKKIPNYRCVNCFFPMDTQAEKKGTGIWSCNNNLCHRFGLLSAAYAIVEHMDNEERQRKRMAN